MNFCYLRPVAVLAGVDCNSPPWVSNTHLRCERDSRGKHLAWSQSVLQLLQTEKYNGQKCGPACEFCPRPSMILKFGIRTLKSAACTHRKQLVWFFILGNFRVARQGLLHRVAGEPLFVLRRSKACRCKKQKTRAKKFQSGAVSAEARLSNWMTLTSSRNHPERRFWSVLIDFLFTITNLIPQQHRL